MPMRSASSPGTTPPSRPAIIGGLASGSGAFGGAFSLEIGEWIALSQSWAIVPQGQLVYASAGADGFTDRDGTTVDGFSGDSFVGRAGVRLEHAGLVVSDAAGATLDAYVLANLAYDFAAGSTGIDVGGTLMSAEGAALMGELGLGATMQIAGGAAFYGETSFAAAASGGDAQRWSGNLGIRFDW